MIAQVGPILNVDVTLIVCLRMKKVERLEQGNKVAYKEGERFARARARKAQLSPVLLLATGYHGEGARDVFKKNGRESRKERLQADKLHLNKYFIQVSK